MKVFIIVESELDSYNNGVEPTGYATKEGALKRLEELSKENDTPIVNEQIKYYADHSISIQEIEIV